MPLLTNAQTDLAVRHMREYLAAAPDPSTGQPPIVKSQALNESRREVIVNLLRPAISRFLEGTMTLEEFKPEIDRINKRHEHWGFKGIKGQMFFNLVFNSANDLDELTAELKAAIRVPDSDEIAKSRIRTFASYVRRLGEAVVEAGGSPHAKPKPSSVPFFLSYFWQVQVPDNWPVYYTNSVTVLNDLNLLEPTEDPGESYVRYKDVHVELQEVFSRISGRQFSLYDVEHVWWYVGQNKAAAVSAPSSSVEPAQCKSLKAPVELNVDSPWDSFVPPVVAALPRLAANDSAMESASQAAATSISRLFEKSIHAAFTILGYDSQLLGQGSGRVPDGIASSDDESYAIIWDAKVRQGGYRMGTDDRAIREYITTHSREIKRRKRHRNLYYFIVSSQFHDDCDDVIRGLKMDTDINEVCLVQADALVALVDLKLRDPRGLSVGPDGFQRLFCESRILTSQIVRDELE